MNYCRKCQSDYEKPGTCNCFAPQAAQPTPVFVPWTVTYPWWTVPYIPCITTSTPCAVCGKVNCNDTHVTYYGDMSEPSRAMAPIT
jgi:hypothetical protein